MTKGKLFELGCAGSTATNDVSPKVKAALKHAKAAGAQISKARHSSKMKIETPKDIKGEVKTDLCYGPDTVSAKLDGDVQLSSAEGTRSAQMFESVLKSFVDEIARISSRGAMVPSLSVGGPRIGRIQPNSVGSPW